MSDVLFPLHSFRFVRLFLHLSHSCRPAPAPFPVSTPFNFPPQSQSHNDFLLPVITPDLARIEQEGFLSEVYVNRIVGVDPNCWVQGIVERDVHESVPEELAVKREEDSRAGRVRNEATSNVGGLALDEDSVKGVVERYCSSE